MKDCKCEIYRDIPDLDGKYQASNLGNIKSNYDFKRESNTDCIKEMAQMVKTFKLDKREVIDIYDNAINAAFVNDESKNIMRSIMLNAFDDSMLKRLNLK